MHCLTQRFSFIKLSKKKVMCCQVWWPILEIGALHLNHPSAHTQQWVVNTHTVNTHPEQWAAIAPAPGEQLGVQCLTQGHLSRGIEGGESAVHSQSPPSIPAGARIKPATFRLQAQLSSRQTTTVPFDNCQNLTD